MTAEGFNADDELDALELLNESNADELSLLDMLAPCSCAGCTNGDANCACEGCVAERDAATPDTSHSRAELERLDFQAFERHLTGLTGALQADCYALDVSYAEWMRGGRREFAVAVKCRGCDMWLVGNVENSQRHLERCEP